MATKELVFGQHDHMRQTAIVGDGVDMKAGDLIIRETENCTPHVEACKVLADETPGKDFKLAAVIPDHVFNRAAREGWLDDPKAWKRWANDGDNAAFRVWKGRL